MTDFVRRSAQWTNSPACTSNRPSVAGGGSRLITAAEEAAHGLGAHTMRLDTRHDLVEARALYAKQRYVEIPPYSDARYADHWFEKRLS